MSSGKRGAERQGGWFGVWRSVASKAYRRASCVVLRGRGEFEVTNATKAVHSKPNF